MDNAVLVSACIGSALARRLVDAGAGRLVHLSARVPEHHGPGEAAMRATSATKLSGMLSAIAVALAVKGLRVMVGSPVMQAGRPAHSDLSIAPRVEEISRRDQSHSTALSHSVALSIGQPIDISKSFQALAPSAHAAQQIAAIMRSRRQS
jgi:NAD(P)-dependent dehydrogenase (short-subunit alcohol dehydrogenase family)